MVERDMSTWQPLIDLCSADLQDLHGLGSLGCVRSIVGKLDEFEQYQGRCSEFTRRLRCYVQRFVISECLHEVEQVRRNANDRS